MLKLKKFLILILTAFIVLLNCMSFTAFAEDETDFPVFLDPSEYTLYDFSDINALSSDLNFSYVDNGYYYFHCSYFEDSEYNNYLSGGDYDIISYFFFSKDVSYVENSDVILFKFSQGFELTSSYSCASNSFTLSSSSSLSGFTGGFYYDKNTGCVNFSTMIYSLPSTLTKESFKYSEYYLFQGTNFPDFPLVPDYSSSSLSSLNVDVVFSPELTGTFSRTVSDRGQTVTLDDFSFKVSNNSKFDIQYLMAIYRESDAFLPFNTDPLVAKYDSNFNGKTYNGSPVYVYVKDEWLYLPHRQNGVITGYAPSSWHMVSAGDSDFVTINFNQIKLNTFQNYNVVVYAIRNDLSYVTPFTNLHEFQVPACADYNVELDTLQLVYSSQFSILNPAEFDATNNDNSYAFDEDDRLLFNRANGYIDENGEMVIDRVDTNQWVTEGSDDPWVNLDSDLNAWDSYYKNQNTVSSDIDQLSRNFSSFFKFVNKFFSYFPKNYQSITLLGLTSLVVLGIIKVVI